MEEIHSTVICHNGVLVNETMKHEQQDSRNSMTSHQEHSEIPIYSLYTIISQLSPLVLSNGTPQSSVGD
ncbi:hypothetical protein XELAEV_18016571mg [Xenopus laevis]|uniref:Uncharacterized protein n=1 Tax=Xenopus laevis TaxID=8355 RepID=A0A974DMI8_XENLA|nr:hypothetical protein XELAEV_18016571mg [Xenopus laevis]